MALSNWDTLAFGPYGTSVPAKFQTNDLIVEIIKNTCTLRFNTDKGVFNDDTNIGVTEGQIDVNGCEINAYSDDNKLFLLVSDYKNEQFFAGIGCEGFDDPTERILMAAGYTEQQINEIINTSYYMTHGSHIGPEGDFLEVDIVYANALRQDFDPNKHVTNVSVPFDEKLDSQWVGVTQELYEQFMSWLEDKKETYTSYLSPIDKAYNDWIEKIKNVKPLRYNQGDMLLTGQYTEVEQADDPVVTQMLKE